MNKFLNISSYKFVPLPDAEELRPLLLARSLKLELKGTILLASEGINLFLAGPAEAVRGFVSELHTDPRFSDIKPKESWSDEPPYKKMLVKVKGEIIRINHFVIFRSQCDDAAAGRRCFSGRYLDWCNANECVLPRSVTAKSGHHQHGDTAGDNMPDAISVFIGSSKATREIQTNPHDQTS